MSDPWAVDTLTEEELAAVLTALRLRAGSVAAPGGRAGSPAVDTFTAWRHRRLAVLGQAARPFPSGPRRQA